jgi:hypothetical protein
MLRSCQSIYVTLCRWSFRNFGHGELPKFKSLFNVSFLLVILLTNVMLLTELMVKFNWVKLNSSFINVAVFSTIFFMLLNHFILLNNRWVKSLNLKLATISKHNLNTWSILLLVNVVAACGFFIVTIR